MTKPPSRTYSEAGVDTDVEESGLARLVARLRGTWPAAGGPGAVQMDFGYFANVVDLGGIGLAISTDGVGTKVLIAQQLQKYDTIGIDCVAMNVNDVLCVGATPISMVDYIAMDEPNAGLLDELSKGLTEGARQAGVSIVGGEIAQLRDVIQGARPGFAFDLAGTAVGTVALDRVNVGAGIVEGDAIVGILSNGIHSNGMTLARKALLEDNPFGVETVLPEIGRPLGEELLRPTHIYVREVLDVLAAGIAVKSLCHCTSDGFLNLSRAAAPVGYDIEHLPETPGIFAAIQEYGDVPIEEMFRVYNMGIGFCLLVAEGSVPRVIEIVARHGKQAMRIGHAVADAERRVWVRPFGLVGRGKRFVKG